MGFSAATREWRFERIYGAFPGRNVMADGNAVVERLAERYIELLSGRRDDGWGEV